MIFKKQSRRPRRSFKEWSHDKFYRTFEVDSILNGPVAKLAKELWANLSMNRKCRQETFEEACERYQVTESRLKEIETALLGKHRAALLLSIVCALLWGYGLYVMSVNMVIMSMGAAVACFMFSFQCNLRVWQIRTRNLGSVREFIQSGGITQLLRLF